MLHRINLWWLAIATVLTTRLLTMAWVPLMDTSEPRYAEIARLMMTSGDFVTPWFEPGTPFWGKPPLSFWCEALAMQWFGISEFAVRFPSWLATVLTIVLVHSFAKAFFTLRVARLAALVYASSSLVFVSAGAVITDPFLTLGVTLSLVAFPLAVKTGTTRWRYGFFVGLAIGLLAKGPLALVLTGLPMLGWLYLHKERLTLLKSLPWFTGTLVTAALSLPWYIAAELKTPGFLNYFIVGEHFMRFVDAGWSGDLYGNAHQRPHGTIWLYWLAASLPWNLVGLAAYIVVKMRSKSAYDFHNDNTSALAVYLGLWAVSTPLFFSAAGNILLTYVQPSLPAIAIIVASLFANAAQRYLNLLHVGGAGFALFSTIAIFTATLDDSDIKSERSLVSFVEAMEQAGDMLVYLEQRPYSARFYSRNKALLTTTAELPTLLKNKQENIFLAIPRQRFADINRPLQQPLQPLYENKRYVLVMLKARSAERKILALRTDIKKESHLHGDDI